MAAPAPVEDDDDDALELTQKVETMGDLDVLEPEPVAAPAPPPRPTLVSEPAAIAAATAFGALSAAIAMPRSDRTLEDVVRELLQPLLKQWLDDNLPKIVQQAVEAEVERISRGGVR
jgi:cell pole-organizing protein PopZ